MTLLYVCLNSTLETAPDLQTSLPQLQFSSASANITASLKRSKKIYCVQLRQYGTMQVCEIRTLDVEYVDVSSMP
jgi:hypothetical protein